MEKRMQEDEVDVILYAFDGTNRPNPIYSYLLLRAEKIQEHNLCLLTSFNLTRCTAPVSFLRHHLRLYVMQVLLCFLLHAA